MQSRLAKGFALLLGSSAAACATTGKGVERAHERGRTTPILTGVWEGVTKATIVDGASAGDTRIERQAWRLTQTGTVISGFYVVELTMMSGDGRPYLCNREPRFSTLIRMNLQGRVTKSGIELSEVGELKSKGTCRPMSRTNVRYSASVDGDVLTLADGERRFALQRRSRSDSDAAAHALLAFEETDPAWVTEATTPAASLREAPGLSASLPPADAAGLWVWENRGLTTGGDEKFEREEWHLVQEGAQISGYYDRAVRQVSGDGHAYKCNSDTDFRIVTRYEVSGEVRGNLIVLFERAFEILEASPCDDGRRKLDAYQGQVDASELRLLWDVGTQVLKRTRPNVPTQRF